MSGLRSVRLQPDLKALRSVRLPWAPKRSARRRQADLLVVTVVLFSARPPSPAESERAQRLGAKALLPKPIGLKELLALIGATAQPRTARGAP